MKSRQHSCKAPLCKEVNINGWLLPVYIYLNRFQINIYHGKYSYKIYIKVFILNQYFIWEMNCLCCISIVIGRDQLSWGVPGCDWSIALCFLADKTTGGNLTVQHRRLSQKQVDKEFYCDFSTNMMFNWPETWIINGSTYKRTV